ncbi:dTDP-4-dehydrorhamnose reductase [Nitrospira sp. Kam-Ns4a]
MRILITGAGGQLGHELRRSLKDHELTLGIRPEFDILKPEVEGLIRAARPEVVIHTAAYTDVEGAEREPAQAMAVNAEGTERVARATAEVGARLIALSTDYVFDGKKSAPYVESDEPNPLNAYGRSKLEGERRALAVCPDTLVVRTSWLYGVQGKNFASTVLRLAREQPELRVVADQRGSPTYARDLAEAIHRLLKTNLRGIVHAAGSGDCTWFEFACAIVDLAGLSVPVRAITTAEARRAAARPPYTVLGGSRLAEAVGPLPPWRDALARFMKEQAVASH